MSAERVLEMRRPGRPADGEKAFHFHHWRLQDQTPAEIVFMCIRCGDQQRIPSMWKPIMPELWARMER